MDANKWINKIHTQDTRCLIIESENNLLCIIERSRVSDTRSYRCRIDDFLVSELGIEDHRDSDLTILSCRDIADREDEDIVLIFIGLDITRG